MLSARDLDVQTFSQLLGIMLDDPIIERLHSEIMELRHLFALSASETLARV